MYIYNQIKLTKKWYTVNIKQTVFFKSFLRHGPWNCVEKTRTETVEPTAKSWGIRTVFGGKTPFRKRMHSHIRVSILAYKNSTILLSVFYAIASSWFVENFNYFECINKSIHIGIHINCIIIFQIPLKEKKPGTVVETEINDINKLKYYQ